MNPKITDFGKFIRAARLGWRLADNLPFFVRMRSNHCGYTVEFYPSNMLVPNDAADKREHLVWWENSTWAELVEKSELRFIKKVNRPFNVYLDNDGEIMK